MTTNTRHIYLSAKIIESGREKVNTIPATFPLPCKRLEDSAKMSHSFQIKPQNSNRKRENIPRLS